jgi:hypothetical protein
MHLAGITLTHNHKLLIGDKWVEAKDVQNYRNFEREARYSYAGDDAYLSSMLPMQSTAKNAFAECHSSQSTRTQSLFNLPRRYVPSNDEHSILVDMETHAKSRIKSKRQRLQTIWCDWAQRLSGMDVVQELLQRHVRHVSRRLNARSSRQQQGIFQRKLSMGDEQSSAIEQEQQSYLGLSRNFDALGRVLSEDRGKSRGNNSAFKSGYVSRGGAKKLRDVELQEKSEVEVSEVYDLIDCGPRNRFLIRNAKGGVFISHNSAGHGLNLQKGGSMIVWFGLNWSLELYQQFNARLHRQGQEKPVRIIHIVAADCIDERVMSVLADKDAQQSKLLNALKPLKKSA